MVQAGSCPMSPEACCISEEMKLMVQQPGSAQAALGTIYIGSVQHKSWPTCAAFSTRQVMVGLLLVWHSGTLTS